MKNFRKGLKQLAAQEFVRNQIATAQRVGVCTVELRADGRVTADHLIGAAQKRGLATKLAGNKIILARQN